MSGTNHWLAISTDLAEQVREARIAAGLTQSQLAMMSDTKQPVISRLESAADNEHLPTVTTLLRIADALKLRLFVSFERK